MPPVLCAVAETLLPSLGGARNYITVKGCCWSLGCSFDGSDRLKPNRISMSEWQGRAGCGGMCEPRWSVMMVVLPSGRRVPRALAAVGRPDGSQNNKRTRWE